MACALNHTARGTAMLAGAHLGTHSSLHVPKTLTVGYLVVVVTPTEMVTFQGVAVRGTLSILYMYQRH